MKSFYLNVISADHVSRGQAGGFTQANHGSDRNLRKMRKGDYMVFYSAKTAYTDGKPLQQFTAICRITDDAPYRVEVTPDFQPWRRAAEFLSVTPAPIRLLIDQLEFIDNKSNWGYKLFRLGMFEISEHDFALIAEAMQAEL